MVQNNAEKIEPFEQNAPTLLTTYRRQRDRLQKDKTTDAECNVT